MSAVDFRSVGRPEISEPSAYVIAAGRHEVMKITVLPTLTPGFRRAIKTDQLAADTAAMYRYVVESTAASAASRVSAVLALADLRTNTSQPNWNGEGARELSARTFDLAERFLNTLPSGVPNPEILAEPDGWIAFDWRSADDEYVLSVSAKDGHELACNGIFSDGEFHGTQRSEFAAEEGEFPMTLVALINRLDEDGRSNG